MGPRNPSAAPTIADAIDAEVVLDPEAFDPRGALDELHSAVGRKRASTSNVVAKLASMPTSDTSRTDRSLPRGNKRTSSATRSAGRW